jgi:PAS domain S-box-containing protein
MKDERKTKRQLIDESMQPRQTLSQERCRVEEPEAEHQDDSLRQRMEQLLRASVEQWYTIFNAMSDAICLLDSQGRIQRCNRAMVELVDRPLGEILDHHHWEVVLGASEPTDECPVVRMWESLSRESLVMPVGDRWFNVSVDPLLANDGQSIGAVVAMADTTERVRSEEERAQAEAALEEAEAYLRTVLNNAPITIFAIDNQGLFTLSEGKGLDHTGLKPGENVGVSALDLYATLSFTEYNGRVTTGKDVIQRVLAGETVNAIDELHGVYFDSHIGPMRDTEGRVIGIVGVATDITERKRAEEALRESESAYQELADSIADVFFAMDQDLRYTYWNKASESLTGIRAEDALGKSILEVFPDVPWMRRAEKVYREVLKTQQSQTFVNETDLKGRCYVFEISAYPSRSGISVFVKDITSASGRRRSCGRARRTSGLWPKMPLTVS